MTLLEIALKETLEQVQEYRSTYRSNEQAVRAQLIDPILTVLGWKTSNAKLVRHNATFDDGKIPDYTLLKNGQNVLIVEAKNLSIILTEQKVINQLSNYCYNQGVDFGVLTNGIRWVLFNTFQKNPHDRIVWEVDLEKESLDVVSRKLSSFSFENIDRLSELLQISKALETSWSNLVASTENIVTIIATKLADRVKAENPTISIGFNEVRSFTFAKILEHFEYSPIDDSPIVDDEFETTSEQKTVFSEMENTVYKRGDRNKIAVTFPDGSKFYSTKVVDTFIDAINKIGVERVKALGLVKSTVPLIGEVRHPKYSQRRLGNYWVMVNVSTKDKYTLLRELSERLDLKLEIELL